MSRDAFHQSVVLAKRWTGPDAQRTGIAQEVVPGDEVVPRAIAVAEDLLRVARSREITGWTKEHLYGENSVIDGPHGAAYMLANADRYPAGPGKVPPTP